MFIPRASRMPENRMWLVTLFEPSDLIRIQYDIQRRDRFLQMADLSYSQYGRRDTWPA
jgi:hypothetical protein